MVRSGFCPNKDSPDDHLFGIAHFKDDGECCRWIRAIANRFAINGYFDEIIFDKDLLRIIHVRSDES